MCLTIPGKVIAIESDKFTIDYGSETRTVEFAAVPIEVGDYVVVSNKVIINKIDAEKAESFLELLK